MKKKKMLVVGGGLSGIATGIYALKAGLDVELIEKNNTLGGLCSRIPNHHGVLEEVGPYWLNGVKPGSELNHILRQVSAVNGNTKYDKLDRFFCYIEEGTEVNFWKDLDRTYQELVELSDGDREEIKKLVEAVKLAQNMKIPTEKPMDMMNPLEMIKLGLSMADIGNVQKEYGKDNIASLAERFQNHYIQNAILGFMNPDITAISFLIAYASFCAGDAAVTDAETVVNGMLEVYERLGGVVHTGQPVTSIAIQGKKAKHIVLKDGTCVEADYVVAACDPVMTFHKLLDSSYMSQTMKKVYHASEDYPVYGNVNAIFESDGKAEAAMNYCIPLKDWKDGEEKSGYLQVYVKPSAKEEKTRIYVQIKVSKDEWNYFKELEREQAKYETFCEQLVQSIRSSIQVIPEIVGRKWTLKGIYTPKSFHSHVGAYAGAVRSFYSTLESSSNLSFSGKIKGLDNVYLAGQWLMPPGGMANAILTGKFVLQRMKKG